MAIINGLSTYTDKNKFGGETIEINVLAPYFRILIHSTTNGEFVVDLKKSAFMRYKIIESFVSQESVEIIIVDAFQRLWEFINLNPEKYNPWSKAEMLKEAESILQSYRFKEKHSTSS